MKNKIQIDGAYSGTDFKLSIVAAARIQINLATMPGLLTERTEEGYNKSSRTLVAAVHNTGFVGGTS